MTRVHDTIPFPSSLKCDSYIHHYLIIRVGVLDNKIKMWQSVKSTLKLDKKAVFLVGSSNLKLEAIITHELSEQNQRSITRKSVKYNARLRPCSVRNFVHTDR
jgi:hypothetical protein